MNRHRTLAIWSLAGDLIREVYAIVGALPGEERMAVGIQLKRAAWSVQNNIAEGVARRGHAELRRFLEISLASLGEVDSMVATLATMGRLDPSRVAAVEVLRRKITAGALALARRRPHRERSKLNHRQGSPAPTSPTPPTPPQHLVP